MATTATTATTLLRSLLRQLHGQVCVLNKSKVFAAVMIVILNVASRYVTIEVSGSMERYLREAFSRQLLLFAILWIGTRDIYVSLCGSLLAMIVIDVLLNEKSAYCCLSESFSERYGGDNNNEKKKKKKKKKRSKDKNT